jgi:hypothetical protein
MVNTQSKDAERTRNVQNTNIPTRIVQDNAGNSTNPKASITLLNDKIIQMTKNMEDLTYKNTALLAHILEQSHTTTIVRDGNLEGEREEHNSHTNGRGGENENPNPNREGPRPNQPEVNDRDHH